MTLSEQSVIGARCRSGSLRRSRCDVCFQVKPDVVSVRVAQPEHPAQALWVCTECADNMTCLAPSVP